MAEKGPMSGKLCVVTGANTGIGRATAEKLAELGAGLVIVCRNRDKGERAAAEIRERTGGPVELMVSDFRSLDSVRSLAGEFLGKHESLQVLVNNAGVNTLWRRSVTADGYETIFQVNYLAPFLLTTLLLGALKKGAPSRIVNVSSASHYGGTMKLDDLQLEKGYGFMKAYGQSKLALVLYTYELSKRLAGTGVTVNSLHPGAIATKMWGGPMSKVFGLFMPGPEKGAETPVYLASSPEVEGVTGKYFDGKREKRSSAESYDRDIGAKLWDLTAKMVGLSSP